MTRSIRRRRSRPMHLYESVGSIKQAERLVRDALEKALRGDLEVYCSGFEFDPDIDKSYAVEASIIAPVASAIDNPVCAPSSVEYIAVVDVYSDGHAELSCEEYNQKGISSHLDNLHRNQLKDYAESAEQFAAIMKSLSDAVDVFRESLGI